MQFDEKFVMHGYFYVQSGRERCNSFRTNESGKSSACECVRASRCVSVIGICPFAGLFVPLPARLPASFVGCLSVLICLSCAPAGM